MKAPSSEYAMAPIRAEIPPRNHRKRMAKPVFSSTTWNPRLVKIPVPIMLAITIERAVYNPYLFFNG